MISDSCILSHDAGRERVLEEVEKTACYRGLEHREFLQLRLLAEELTGMTAGLVGHYEAEFWIETQGRAFALHMALRVKMDEETKERLLRVATSGKNEAERSLMGKLRGFLESCAWNYDDLCHYCSENGIQAMEGMYAGCSLSGGQPVWSLKRYARSVQEGKEWDELEQSIVAKLADDILVTIRRDRTEIVVKKTYGGSAG